MVKDMKYSDLIESVSALMPEPKRTTIIDQESGDISSLYTFTLSNSDDRFVAPVSGYYQFNTPLEGDARPTITAEIAFASHVRSNRRNARREHHKRNKTKR